MLNGPGQARLETPLRQGPVHSQCPCRADTPAPIAAVPDAGEHRRGCSNPPLGWALQSRTKSTEMPWPSRHGGGCSCSRGAPGPRCAASNSAPMFPGDFYPLSGMRSAERPFSCKTLCKGTSTAPQPSQRLDKHRDSTGVCLLPATL